MILSNIQHKLLLIRLHCIGSLIFFACTLLQGCRQATTSSIEIVYHSNTATAIAVPKRILNGATDKEISNKLKVYVDTTRSISMLGDYLVESERVVFTPLVPLSGNMDYAVYFNDELLGKVQVSSPVTNPRTSLLTVYPAIDTVPENLLKVYLQFSAPMREGQSLKHIALINRNNDTLPDIFLDLQPELWNKERTVLTVWLDPGRIKRDLIPNRQSGNPLKQGESFTLVVSSGWKDRNNLPLQQEYKKAFVVGARDSLSPALEQWNLQVPSQGTREPLNATFNDVLDYFLAQESVRVVANTGIEVAGKTVVIDNQTKLRFTPDEPWLPGVYNLQVDPVLEDLSGNNLNRPFDRDLQVKNPNADRTSFEKRFEVK
ncbi:hypothetical protein EXU57_20570 [Segetibacter sp. 3557_3]|uniref:Ig-like domain-containing protein n=1 Tax=Segetibacter sp. 3557_3 TaxID=2547429 RepID=UPI001058D5D6|nr:Ig-like domain-containing protein [Segetibacter sp. 3557_3]TDH21332.1 hypothetical protein EXU57_20570 [Segetibacter sp. 3557_3]